jgi:hypothetical protein
MFIKNALLFSLIVLPVVLLFSCKAKPVETSPVETKITGRVSEKTSNNPIVGSIVSTQPSTSSVTTDVNGNYTIINVVTGQYVVTASKEGYKQSSTSISIKEGQTSSADMQLEQLTPALTVSAAQLNFGTTQTIINFTITNSTSFGSLQWSIENDANWISLSNTFGTITSGVQQITVIINRTGLDYGNYNSILAINSNGGNKDLIVTMTVQNPNAPQLTVNPLILDFGETINNLKFAITNTGTGKLTWNVSSTQQWISITPQTDSTKLETDSVSVQINRSGLTPGNYAGQITIASNAGNQIVNVQLSIQSPPTLSVSTNQLDFGSTLTNLTFAVSNTGGGILNWSIVSNQTWLTVNPINGSGSFTINVYLNRSGISSGNYSGMLTVSSNGGNASVNVNMSVASATNPTAVILNALTNITTSSVELDWAQNSDSDFKQYEIHKSTTAGFTPSTSTLVQTITTKNTINVTVSGLTAGTTYYFKIRVVNTNNLFSDSNERNATTNSANIGPYVTDANTIGLWHFDEISGNTVADVSANGNNGVSTGTTIVSGKYGKGRQFTASTGDKISLGSNSSLIPSVMTITVEFWLYFINEPSPGGSVVEFDAGSNYWFDYIGNKNLSWNIKGLGKGPDDWQDNGIPLNTWTHIAGTYDGDTLKLFYNGILKGKRYAKNTSWDNSLGKELLIRGNFDYVIDEFRISKVVRKPEDFHLK